MQTSAGYIVVSLCIGVVGAAFVITQYHTTRMYAGKIVGTANATSAGVLHFIIYVYYYIYTYIII